MKVKRLLVILLSLVLLIGSAFAVGISADETATGDFKILSKNISYDGDMKLLVAVPKDSFDGDITLTIEWVENTGGARGTETVLKIEDLQSDGIEDPVIGGVPCYAIMAGRGVSTKDMGAELDVTISSTKGGNAVTYSEKYSVLQYVYAKLYEDAILYAEEGTPNAARRALYLSTINLAKYSEKVLYDNLNDDASDDLKTHADEWIYSNLEGSPKLYQPGDTIKISKYTKLLQYTLKDGVVEAKEIFATSDVTLSAAVSLIENPDKSETFDEGLTDTEYITPDGGDITVEDIDGNKVLVSASNNGSLNVHISSRLYDVYTDNNTYVFNADFYLTAGDKIGDITFCDAEGNVVYTLSLDTAKATYYYPEAKSSTLVAASYAEAGWHTLKVELYQNNRVKVYIDGDCYLGYIDGTARGKDISALSYASLSLGNAQYDNIGFAVCDVTFAETNFAVDFENGNVQDDFGKIAVTDTLSALSVQSDVAGNVGKALQVQIKSGATAAPVINVGLTNEDPQGSLYVFEMDIKGTSYTNTGDRPLMSLSFGNDTSNVFYLYNKYGVDKNHYGKGMGFGLGARNILTDAYDYNASTDTSYVIPYNEWYTLRLELDLGETPEVRVLVKSSATGDKMTEVASITADGTTISVPGATRTTNAKFNFSKITDASSVKIAFNQANVSTTYVDNLSYTRETNEGEIRCDHSSMGDWENTVAASCNVFGVDVKRCECGIETCDYVETRQLAKLQHIPGADVPRKEPTCVSTGYEAYNGCANCGEVSDGSELVILEKIPHNLVPHGAIVDNKQDLVCNAGECGTLIEDWVVASGGNGTLTFTGATITERVVGENAYYDIGDSKVNVSFLPSPTLADDNLSVGNAYSTYSVTADGKIKVETVVANYNAYGGARLNVATTNANPSGTTYALDFDLYVENANTDNTSRVVTQLVFGGSTISLMSYGRNVSIYGASDKVLGANNSWINARAVYKVTGDKSASFELLVKRANGLYETVYTTTVSASGIKVAGTSFYFSSYSTNMNHTYYLDNISFIRVDTNCYHKDGEVYRVDSWEEILAPTCTAEGTKQGVCTECGETVTVAVPIIPHTEQDVPAVDATCTTAGSTAGKRCTVCERYTVLPVEIPALGHTAEDWVIDRDANCTESGMEHQVCTRCGENFNETKIPALGHSFSGDWTTSAQNSNYEERRCTVCERIVMREKNTPVTGFNSALPYTQTYTDALHGASLETGGRYNVFMLDFKLDSGVVGDTKYIFRVYFYDDGSNGVQYFNINTKGNTVYVDGTALDTKFVADTENGTWISMMIVQELPGNNTDASYHNFKVFMKLRDSDDPMEFVTSRTDISTNYARPNRNYKVTISELTDASYGYSIDNISFIRTNDTQYYYYNCDHDMTAWTTENAATCTEYGTVIRSCNVCGHLEREYVDALGHTVVVDEAVAPTCTTTGLTEGSHCSVCNEVFVAQQIVDALGHTEMAPVIENNVDPDCVTAGSYDSVVYCSVCGGEVSRVHVTVDALGHTEMAPVIENNVDPDCVTEGSYDSVVYCSVCDAEVSRDHVIVPANGHDDSEWIESIPVGCFTDGEHYKVCNVCGEETAREAIPATGHTFVGGWTTAADNDKYEERQCTVCDRIQRQEKNNVIDFANGAIIDPNNKLSVAVGTLKGEDVAPVNVVAGSVSGGNGRFALSVEEAVLKVVATNNTNYNASSIKIFHTDAERSTSDQYLVFDFDVKFDYGTSSTAVVFEARISDDGNNGVAYFNIMTYKNEVKVDYTVLDKTKYVADNNNGTWISFRLVTELDTDGKNASDKYEAVTKIYVKPQGSDEPMQYIKSFTCESKYTGHLERDNGYNARINQYVNKDVTTVQTYYLDNISFIRTSDANYLYGSCAHDMGEWNETKAATCTERGTVSRSCEVEGCGYTEVEYVPALGHVLVDVDGLDATCTEPGYTDYKACSRCDHIEGKEVIEALGHTDGEWITDTPASCFTDGAKHQICAACGETIATGVIPAAHTFGNWHAAADANYEQRDCSVCGRYQLREKNTPVADVIVNSSTSQTITYTDALHPSSNANGGKYNVFELDFKMGTGSTSTSDVNHFKLHFYDDGNNGIRDIYVASNGSRIKIAGVLLDAKYIADDENGTWNTVRIVDEIPDAVNANSKYVHNIKIFVKPRDAGDDAWEFVTSLTVSTNYGHGNRGYKFVLGHLSDDSYELANASLIRTADANYFYGDCAHEMGEWIVTPATCVAIGNATRSCTVEGCKYTELEYIPMLAHNYVYSEPVNNKCTISCNNGCGYVLENWVVTPDDKGAIDFENGAILDDNGKLAIGIGAANDASFEPADPIIAGETTGGNPEIKYSLATGIGDRVGTVLKAQIGSADADNYKSERIDIGMTAGSASGTTHVYDLDVYYDTVWGLVHQFMVNGTTYNVDRLVDKNKVYAAFKVGDTTVNVPTKEWVSLRFELEVVSDTEVNFNLYMKRSTTSDRYEKVASTTFASKTSTLFYISDYNGRNGSVYYLDNISYCRVVTVCPHDQLGEWATTQQPTCTTEGVKEATCQICGATIRDTVAMVDHTVVADEAVAATCTATGLTAGSHCGECGVVLVEQTVTPALGHTAGAEATCTTAQICTVCGAEIAPALGHTEEEIPAVDATCTTTGLTAGKRCSVCGVTTEAQNVVPALGHTEEDIPAVDATCTTTGLTAGKKCSVCGEITVAQTVTDALGHTEETIPAVDATCTTTGLTAGVKCSVCQAVITEQQVVDALGHSFGELVLTTPATCTENGVMTAECANCDATTTAVVYAEGHKYVSFADATDTKYEYATCECGHVQYREKVNAITFESGKLLDSSKLTYTAESTLSDSTATEFGNAWTMFSIAERAENKMLKLAYNYAAKDGCTQGVFKVGLTDTIRNTAEDKYLVYDMDVVIELPEDYDYTIGEYRAITRVTFCDESNNVIFTNDIQVQRDKVFVQYGTTGITLDHEGNTKISLRFVFELATAKEGDYYKPKCYVFAKEADANQNWKYVTGATKDSTYTGHITRGNYFIKMYEETMSANYASYFIPGSALLVDNISFIATADDNCLYTACSRTNLSDWTVIKTGCDGTDGERERHCLDEGCEYEERETILAGHRFDETTTVDPTCATAGSRSGVCTVCDEHVVIEVLPALGHNFSDWTDSSDANYEQRSCEVCGHYQLREKNTPVADITVNASTSKTITYTDALHPNGNANGGKYNVFEVDFRLGTGATSNSTVSHCRIYFYDDGSNAIRSINVESYGPKVKIDGTVLDAKYVANGDNGTWNTVRIVDVIPDAANASGKYDHTMMIFVKPAGAGDDAWEFVKTISNFTTNYGHGNRGYKVILSHISDESYEYANASLIRTNDTNYLYSSCKHELGDLTFESVDCLTKATCIRSCTVEGCEYVERTYLDLDGHIIGEWTDSADGKTQTKKCTREGCDYCVTRDAGKLNFDNGTVIAGSNVTVDLLNTTTTVDGVVVPMEGAQAITSTSTEGGNPYVWYSVVAAPNRLGETALKVQTVQAYNKDPYKGSRYTVRNTGATEGNVYTVDVDVYHEKTYDDSNSSYIFTQFAFGGSTISIMTYGPNVRIYGTTVVLGAQDTWISMRVVYTVNEDSKANADIYVKDANGAYTKVHTMTVEGSAIKVSGVSSMYFSSYSTTKDHTYYLDNISFTRSAE